MRVKHQSNSRLVLTGIPGGRIAIIALTLLGVLLTAGVGFVAVVVYKEHKGIAWPHLPVLLGLLIAQALFWTGTITLAVGRLMLILDTATGTGEYRVTSPIIDAGSSCKFKLENVHSITIETATESRPQTPGQVSFATVHRARLRLDQPRRAITLDETENDGLDRLESLAQDVASFLGKTVKRVDHV